MICEASGGIINKLVVLLGIGIMGLMANPVYAGNWWDADFSVHSPRWSEDDGSGSWGKFWTHGNIPRHRWAVDVVGGGHPRRAGAQSIRFERRTGYCGGDDCGWNSERTELGTDGVDRPGDNTWYAWSVYHQNYQFLDNVSPIHGQFKTRNDGHQLAFFNMDASRGMVVNFDEFEGWSGSKVIIPKSQIPNKWNDIRVYAKWSTGADGIFRIWVNGVLKVDRRGRNMVNSDPVMFRFGIYAPQVNRAGAGRPTQVVYYDELMRGNSCQNVSQFMACDGKTNGVKPYTGGAGGNGTQTSGSGPGATGSANASLETYVNKYGDLLAAYNANSGGQSKTDWGKRHYCTYGHGEGRTSSGLTSSVCATTLDTTSPTIEVSVNDIRERADRFSDEITQGVGEFSKTAVFNGGIFSFKDYETFRAIKVRENQGLMLGFSKHRNKDGGLHDPVGIGWLFDDVALMVAQDNSMFGYRAEGVFDFKDPSTTYIGAGFRKKLSGKAMLYTDLMYAFGRSQPGELTTLSHLHALGLETHLDIRANWRNRFQFRFDLPLRIEHGSSRFYVELGGRVHPLVIDLEPAVRQSSLSFNHSYRWSRKSWLISEINYTHNPNHRRGTNDYHAHLRVQYRF